MCAPPPPGVFNWIVAAINVKLDMGKKTSGRFIAILDIYGFEQFQTNRWGWKKGGKGLGVRNRVAHIVCLSLSKLAAPHSHCVVLLVMCRGAGCGAVQV